METKIELERRWLLKRCPDWVQEECTKDEYLYQFYTEDGWRYRKTEHAGAGSGKTVYHKLRKMPIERGMNQEVDIQEITKKEYKEQRKNAVKQIEKNRMTVPYQGKNLEFDVFLELDLVILEIEDVTFMDTIIFPPEIEKNIIMEITGNSIFSNFNLADEIDPENEDSEDDEIDDYDDDND